MAKITRRSMVTGLAAMPFGLWFEKYGLGQKGREKDNDQDKDKDKDKDEDRDKHHVRYSAYSVQGQKMLKIYADAVCKMKNSIKEGDPISWVFQWYTHWVKGSTSKAAEISRIYGAGPSPHKALANDVWDTCQAHGPGDIEDFFLPWHRMFVFHFEQIIRHVSGKHEFTLPYWNYSAAGPNHGVMPIDFRKSADPEFKCLYVDKRNVHTSANSFANVNAGEPIDKYEPGTLDLTALKQSTYSPAGAAPGFNMDLDGSVHGAVHVLIGNSQNMGSVPWAAGDAIFWMHHCNIDRLWASWNHCGGKNPTTAAWLNQTFAFADDNGNKVVDTVKNVDDTAKLDYSYDHLEPCPLNFKPLSEAEAAAIKSVILASATPAAPLTKQPVRVPLEVKAPEVLRQQKLREHVRALPEPRHLYVVIKNLHADVHPEAIYRVYLDLPEGKSPKEGKEYEIGTINFFNSVPHEGHKAGMESGAANRFYSFEVTDIAKKVLQDKPTVTIAPLGEPAAEAKPVVGEVSLVEQ